MEFLIFSLEGKKVSPGTLRVKNDIEGFYGSVHTAALLSLFVMCRTVYSGPGGHDQEQRLRHAVFDL